MPFGHEQLDVYRVSIQYVSWAYEVAKGLQGMNRHARDQLLRASQSIPLNIAEGNGKGTNADRRRFFEIARGSALECAAIQDCLESCQAMSAAQNVRGKTMLTRIVSMLTKLGRRRHEVREELVSYDGFDCDVGDCGNGCDDDSDCGNDNDNDNDNDSDNDSDNDVTEGKG